MDTRLPVIKDFFAFAEQAGLRDSYAPLWRFSERLGIRWEQLRKGKPNIEEFFSAVDVLATRLWQHKALDDEEISRMDVSALQEMGILDYLTVTPRDYVVSFIFDVLASASSPLARQQCDTHRRFVDGLSRGDAVISLNYDLLLDASLAASGRWTPYDGYGTESFTVGSMATGPLGLNTLRATGFHPIALESLDVPVFTPKPLPGGSEVSLLKLHGSLNWWRVRTERMENPALDPHVTEMTSQEWLSLVQISDVFKLVGRLLEPQRRVAEDVRQRWPDLGPDDRKRWLESNDRRRRSRPREEGVYLVPPTMHKMPEAGFDRPVVQIWDAAARALSEASEILVIGYSFPVSDYTIRLLLADSVARARSAPGLTIVNPKADRVRSNMESATITPRIRLRRLRHETFDEFVDRGM